MINSKKFIVVIRHVNERTLDECVRYAKKITDDVHLVTGNPFKVTLEKSLKIGLKSNKRYLICIDGDVIIHPQSLLNLLNSINYQDKLFEFQGLVNDYFFNGPRPGGVHIYNIKNLQFGLNILSSLDDIRPEGRMIAEMRTKGFIVKQFPNVVGIHDYFQYKKDIYRKAFIHAYKHNHLIDHFEDNLKNDNNFKIVQKAFKDSCLADEHSVDASKFSNEILDEEDFDIVVSDEMLIKTLHINNNLKHFKKINFTLRFNVFFDILNVELKLYYFVLLFRRIKLKLKL